MTGPIIGMISYNPILKGRDNGWINDSLFIIQSDRGQMFGAPEVGFGESPNELTDIRYERVDVIQQTVAGHWKLLAEVLPQLDRVFIYVGSDGSEYAIRYAASHGLKPSEVVFVLCDCNEA